MGLLFMGRIAGIVRSSKDRYSQEKVHDKRLLSGFDPTREL